MLRLAFIQIRGLCIARCWRAGLQKPKLLSAACRSSRYLRYQPSTKSSLTSGPLLCRWLLCLRKTSISVNAVYFGGFGVTVLAAPQIYFKGGASPVTYWRTKYSDKGPLSFFARAFGAGLTGMAAMNLLADNKAAVELAASVNLLTHALFMPLFYTALLDRDAEKNGWTIQLVLGSGMLCLAGAAYTKNR